MTNQAEVSTTEYWFPIVHDAMPHGTNPLISKSVATAVSMEVEFRALPAVIADRDALQARISELEATLERAESCYVEARAVVELRQNERNKAQARVAELEAYVAKLEPIAQAAKGFRRDNSALQARAELLTAALTDAAEGLDRILLPGALHTNWHELKSYSTNARAALAAGETESEAP